MGFEDFVSESEAASYSGVSVGTLRRFVEAGYLHIESDADGLQLFAKSELAKLFGLHDFESLQSQQVASINSASIKTESIKNGSNGNAKEALSKHEQAIEPNGHLGLEKNFVPSELSSALEKEISCEVNLPIEVANPSQQDSIQKTNAAFPGIKQELKAAAVSMLEFELQKLRNVVKLQESLLELREGELKDIKEQREWLKERLERQEQKSERDQILLLSETQTIKKLISYQEEKRSAFRAALEWFGFVGKSTSRSNLEKQQDIEITKTRQSKE